MPRTRSVRSPLRSWTQATPPYRNSHPPRLAATSVLLILWFAATSWGGDPSLYFDVTPLVACRPLHDPEFETDSPGEELIEARCQVSVLASGEPGGTPDECLFHFFSPETHTRVQDFLPKTALVTDVVGTVRVSQGRERTQGLEFSTGAQFETVANAKASVSGSRHQSYSVSYDRLPPRETLTAVGTLGRGAGVYFKQRRTSQTSLEGAREFVLILRVPQGWRAGYLRLVCQARSFGAQGGRGDPLMAAASYLVPLFRAGDLEAKQAGELLFLREQQLIADAYEHRAAIGHARRPSVIHELLLADPKFPEEWLSIILRGNSRSGPEPFETRLPPSTIEKIARYRQSRTALSALSTAGKRSQDDRSSSRPRPPKPHDLADNSETKQREKP